MDRCAAAAVEGEDEAGQEAKEEEEGEKETEEETRGRIQGVLTLEQIRDETEVMVFNDREAYRKRHETEFLKMIENIRRYEAGWWTPNYNKATLARM